MRVLPTVLSIAFLLHGVAIAAAEPTHPAVPPEYCDLVGTLTMENCALVNSVLAEKFFDAAYEAAAHPNNKARQRDQSRIVKVCHRKWAESRTETGGGTLDDVVERECLADGYHAAAAKLLGLNPKREIILRTSTQEPSYCEVEGENPYGCAYINRLIAYDYLRRVEFAAGLSDINTQPQLEDIEAACKAQLMTQSKKKNGDVLRLKCIYQRLHEAAKTMSIAGQVQR